MKLNWDANMIEARIKLNAKEVSRMLNESLTDEELAVFIIDLMCDIGDDSLEKIKEWLDGYLE